MAKQQEKQAEPLTVESVRQMAAEGKINAGQGKRSTEQVAPVTVLRPFKDNGKDYSPGDTCHMALSLIPRHAKAGIVELQSA